jgi:alpha-glucoside transport system substrate-binding protein
MYSKMFRRMWGAIGLLVVASLVASCAPTTVTVEVPVERTVEVEVPGEQVVVTATPAPVEAGEDIGKVFILGAFRGEEETAFNAVIAVFEEQNPDIDVIYSGTAEFETLITVRVEAGDAPDIAAFPQPGAVAKFAQEGQLVPLWDEALAVYDAEYTPAWKDLGSVDGVPYGMFHRVNAKGWIWYNKPAFEAAGYEIPNTWDELMALTEELKGTGIAPWCDGIESGAATGWKGTDWIENLILRTQPVEVHDKWVAHEVMFDSPEVRTAWSYLDGIWMDPDAVYGGAPTIALTNFKDAAPGLFTDPPQCWLHMQGSFVTNFFQEEVQADLDNMVGVFMMPPIDEALPFTLEVGGDQFVVFNGKDRPEVRKFIEFLGTPASVEPWAKQGGSLFPHVNQDLSWYPTELERTMAEAITKAAAARFDGSDMMASELNLAFWKGVTDWVSGARTLDEALADIDASME